MRNEKKRFPVIRFPEFSEDWEPKRLRDLVTRVTRKNKTSCTNVLTISAQLGLISQVEFFNKSVAGQDVSGYYLLQRDDFAYNKSYSTGYPMGAVKRLRRYPEGIVSTLYICFSANSEVNKDYLEKFFEAGGHNREISKIAQEGARNHGLLNIAVEDFFGISLLTPRRPEQDRIAAFLSTVDEKIGYLSKIRQLLLKYKKGVIRQIFDQEFRFKADNRSDFSDWEEQSLSTLVRERKTRNSNNEVQEVFSVAKNSGVINQVEHLGRSYAAEDISNYKVVLPGDIVYTKSPTSEFPYGIIKQNKTGRTGVVSVLYAVFSPKTPQFGLLLDYYFSSWVKTYNYLNPIVQKGAKNTINIGNEDFLRGKKISLPTSTKEVGRIVGFLSALDKKIALSEVQLENMKSFKKGLLQQMFV
jgi:type I restriction enzyme S subunit